MPLWAGCRPSDGTEKRQLSSRDLSFLWLTPRIHQTLAVMPSGQVHPPALTAEQASATHGLQYRLRHCFRFTPRLGIGHRQRLDDLALPARCDGAIAQERGQHALVAEVLAPCLELLGVPAKGLPKLDERGPEAVRVEVRQPWTRMRAGRSHGSVVPCPSPLNQKNRR